MKEHMSPQIFSQINPQNLFHFCGHLFFLSARTLYEVQRISFTANKDTIILSKGFELFRFFIPWIKYICYWGVLGNNTNDLS